MTATIRRFGGKVKLKMEMCGVGFSYRDVHCVVQAIYDRVKELFCDLEAVENQIAMGPEAPGPFSFISNVKATL
jgi:hypothetical protein